MEFTPLILIHIATAAGALVSGAVTLGMRKGTRTHRIFGRTWVLLMAATLLVSFGIRTSGHFSWIHLLSAGTLVALAASIYAVLHGNIRAHRRGMVSAYIGLAVAGAFTLLPGRSLGGLLWQAVGVI
ncbi:MAG TPA: DUF2306 domain-containing protein [Noviherbaspirillum sp.]|uniref:DUF2306 domain-containing protein n=1 Tax=Noviherbaspirillum sp. TaxID=1926288 RepID=UPI002D6EC198|nr:DUF2306 domain-containing protein [Noviherbaspirillum sp.]HYD97419.1 DUF2306 domain-containing protein [Noviherbaspirillum sp.]